MNAFFGGNVKKELIDRHFADLVQISRKYLPDNPRQILVQSENNDFRICGINGQNNGVGFYQDEKIAILFQGEIYNFREKLDKSIDPLYIRNDWAKLVGLEYQQSGTKIFQQIDGLFTLVIYDKVKQQILLARDEKGYRMLYYSQEDDQFIFASRLWSVSQLRSTEPVVRQDLLAWHFNYGFEPLENTILKDIYKVKPGEIVTYDFSAKKLTKESFSFESNWPLIQQAKEAKSIDEAKKLLYQAFMASLDDVSWHQKKVGVLLGGVDSAATASGLNKLNHQVETFSFQWGHNRFNQKNIDSFEKYTGIPHNWLSLDKDYIFSRLTSMYDYVDEPRSELTYMIGTTELCGMARKKGFLMVATGDEAESVMGGYPALHGRVMLIRRLQRWPKIIRSTMIYLLSLPTVINRGGHPIRNLLSVLRKTLDAVEKRFFLVYRPYDQSEMPLLFPQVKLSNYLQQANDFSQQLIQPSLGLEPEFMAHRGNEISASIRFKHCAPGQIYEVTVISPFLHKNFIAFIQALNKKILYPQGYEKSTDAKWLFREMVKEYGLLPVIVSDQKKDTPGNSPIDYWLEKEAKPEVDKIIATLPDYFSRQYIHCIFKPKILLELYRRIFGVSAVTSHAQQALIGFALFLQYFNKNHGAK